MVLMTNESVLINCSTLFCYNTCIYAIYHTYIRASKLKQLAGLALVSIARVRMGGRGSQSAGPAEQLEQACRNLHEAAKHRASLNRRHISWPLCREEGALG